MECAGGFHCPCISSPDQNQLCIPAREQRKCENPNYLREDQDPQTYMYINYVCRSECLDAKGLA